MTNITTDTRVRIENRGDGWDDVTATVTRTGEEGFYLDADSTENPFQSIDIGHWTEQYLTPIDAPKVGRPTIDFSTPSRETARRYAEALPSRILLAEHNTTLKRVAQGSAAVDAYRLNEALMASMRSGATRFGQSVGRREFTRKVAYLAHITQAVLENHADQLPIYEGGPRSPRIAALEKQVEDERTNLRCAEKLWGEERSNLTQAASDERRRLCSEIDALKDGVAEAKAEIEELTNILEASRQIGEVRDRLVDDTAQERNTLGAVLAYVFERADEAFQAEISGYWNGLLDGTGQDRS
jgi:hypothetical protein